MMDTSRENGETGGTNAPERRKYLLRYDWRHPTERHGLARTYEIEKIDDIAKVNVSAIINKWV